MSIQHFKVLQAVLSQTRDVICDVYGLSKDEAFERAEKFIKENSEKWRLDDPQIDYDDPFCRMAYLYMNVAVHANLVELAINSFPEVQTLIRDRIETGKDLRVCALGGGPGSELLGLVRFIQGLNIPDKTAYLDFVLVDRVKEWDESWHALKEGVDGQMRAEFGDNRSRWPISTSRSFLPLNATSVTDFENFATRFSGTDLFIFCYLVSELKAFTPGFEQVLSLLAARASPGAMLLFIDRDERQVREGVQAIIANNRSLTPLAMKKERGRSQDDLSELGEWYINIPSLPRQRWLAFFALAQKNT